MNKIKLLILTALSIISLSLSSQSFQVNYTFDGASWTGQSHFVWLIDDGIYTEHNILVFNDSSSLNMTIDSICAKPLLLSNIKHISPSTFVFADNNGYIGTAYTDSLYLGITHVRYLKDSLGNKYTKAVSDAKYKPISYVPAWSDITSKPSFATVSTTGTYSDLIGKPSLSTVATTGVYSDLSGKPTTLSGFGITDGTSTARSAISLTTTGTSGNATYSSSTGVINIPNYTYTPSSWSFNNTPGRSLVTGTGATGFQVSSTRNADVSYSVTIVSTASISGSAVGYIALEICATNSATASDWVEVSRVPNGQAVSLAVVLQSISTGGGVLTASIPAGYYVKLRSVNTTGTQTFTYNSGQETLK